VVAATVGGLTTGREVIRAEPATSSVRRAAALVSYPYHSRMTDTAQAGEEIVVEQRSSRWRALRWMIVGLLIAALIGVPTWWLVATDTSHLEQGSLSSGDAWRIQAGDTDVYCFGIAPGDSIRLGFSLRNASSHTITITGIP